MRRVVAMAGTVALLVLISGCDVSGTLPEPIVNPKSTKDAASATACMANMKAIYASEQAFQAQKGSFGSAGDLEEFSGPLPKEPSGGSYSIDASSGRVTCSIGHGSVPER